MVPKIINSLKLDLPIPLYGDGQNIRDWLYVEDHCQGIWLAMINGRAGQVYNLGGGIEYTNLELITTIAKEFDIATPLIEFVADRKGHDFRYSLNYKKATKELDYRPLFTFSEAITRTIRSYS
jgi:dTDP-glucose 4,6-dehydratase